MDSTATSYGEDQKVHDEHLRGRGAVWGVGFGVEGSWIGVERSVFSVLGS